MRRQMRLRGGWPPPDLTARSAVGSSMLLRIKEAYSAVRVGNRLKAGPLRIIREEMQATPGLQASPDSISELSGP
jgi:hypothetical protein